jgi:4-amino-4-deoxy-L-arabinose transferase-like glycosyltransferase
MNAIRIANVFVWAIVPVTLFFFLYNQKSENNLFIALISSLLCALFPIGILMGTTAQPEPLFTLLLLLFAIAASKEKYLLSSILLTCYDMKPGQF